MTQPEIKLNGYNALFGAETTKTAIFAVTPVADLSYNFFVSLLYTQLFQIIYDYGNAHGYLKVPLHFLMDEFANGATRS